MLMALSQCATGSIQYVTVQFGYDSLLIAFKHNNILCVNWWLDESMIAQQIR